MINVQKLVQDQPQIVMNAKPLSLKQVMLVYLVILLAIPVLELKTIVKAVYLVTIKPEPHVLHALSLLPSVPMKPHLQIVKLVQEDQELRINANVKADILRKIQTIVENVILLVEPVLLMQIFVIVVSSDNISIIRHVLHVPLLQPNVLMLLLLLSVHSVIPYLMIPVFNAILNALPAHPKIPVIFAK